MQLKLLSLCVLLASACAAFVPRAEYRDYRAVRLAENDETELRAIGVYLDAHPEGQWAGDLRAKRAEMEQGYFELAKESGEGLRAYLDIFPEGRFAAEAERRLSAMSNVSDARNSEDAERRARVEGVREEMQEARRQWAAQATEFWSRVLLSVNGWDRPMAEVVADNPAFDDAFRAAPRPRCSSSECVKFYTLDYAIAVPGQTRLERRMRIMLRLRFSEAQVETPAKLVGAELLMPNRGFTRWYELETGTPVLDLDPESRSATLEWAVERLVPMLRRHLPNAVGIDVIADPIDVIAVLENEGDEAAPATDPASLSLPVTLQGLRDGDREIVVFAASEDDEGPAYDGFYVRFAEPADESADEGSP